MATTREEIDKSFGQACEKFFHIANVLNSGLPEIKPELQRKLIADAAAGFGHLAHAIQLQSSRL